GRRHSHRRRLFLLRREGPVGLRARGRPLLPDRRHGADLPSGRSHQPCRRDLDMTTTLWLRISSVVSLLFAAGHALGGRKHWSPLGETEVLRTMRDVRFDVMGGSRTSLDFFKGFGHLLTVSTVLQAILLWQMGSLSKSDPARLRPMIAAFVLAAGGGG